MTDRQWYLFWNACYFAGVLGFIALCILISIAMRGQAIELILAGNATGHGQHVLEVSGPMVVGNGSEWLVIGGM